MSKLHSKKSGARLVFILAEVALLLAAFLAGGAAVAFWYLSRDLPNPALLSAIEIPESTKIYDRTGKTLLYEVRGEQKRTVVSLEKMPMHLRQATLAIEDVDFYRHAGISGRGVLRALLQNIRAGGVIQGGSSITQQLVKNLFLTPERTIKRKLRETILALELEGRYSKDEILSLYLNTVSYGANAYGVEAASETYFGKKTQDITLAEAAYLSALPRAPSYYSPYGSHKEALQNRAEYILRRMRELGYIDEGELALALKEKVTFLEIRDPIVAPHFVLYVRELLEEKYGQDFLERGGLKIITSLEAELQKEAERAIKKWAPINEEQYRATNAALVAQDPKTGEVLAMVGSRDYFDVAREGNFNVATSPNRQPGSAIKPIVYGVAFEKGLSDKTVVFDLETEFDTTGLKQNSYQPQNADGKYLGPVTLHQALAQSRNVASVKVLYLAGMDAVREKANELGITTIKNPARYGLSLVLGGAEVRLSELVGAYASFANDGVFVPQRFVLRIERANGEVLEETRLEEKRVWQPTTARLITDILKDNEARAPVFGSQSPLYFPGYEVAAKTGTTEKFWDAWAVGYSPGLVVGVWTGNNDRSSMLGIRGGAAGLYTAAPIFHELMEYRLKAKEPETFPKPQEETPLPQKPMLNGSWKINTARLINKLNNRIATSFTPPELIETRSYEDVHSILYYVNPDNITGAAPRQAELDPQFLNWEGPVRSWARGKGINLPPDFYDTGG